MEDLVDSKEIQLVYWSVLILLVMLAVWYLNKIKKRAEDFKAYPYSAGASMRINQSIPSTVTTPPNENLGPRHDL